MLTNVPGAVNRMARNVVVNHPNTWECQVFRKSVNRVSEGSMGGLPTMGGLGVLDSEDEEKIEYEHLGNGYVLQSEAFAASPLMDRQDANNGTGGEFRFLIEPEHPSGMSGYFDIRKGDVLYLVLADDVKLAFEIVGTETTLNIPPFVTRYVVNRRGDLNVTEDSLSGWTI